MIKEKLYRVLQLPLGLILGLFEIANNKARDLNNKRRFPKAIIDKGSTFSNEVKIGMNAHILGNSIINKSTIGNYSYCNRNVLIQNATIGNYCSIASEVIVGLGNHPLNLFSTATIFYKSKNTLNIKLLDKDYEFDEYKPIIIENDVWIGTRAIIMDGITIGTGAVIAAGAVVTKDVPPYAIVAGVPAKILKYRFDANQIERLLESKWWEMQPHEANEFFKKKHF